MATLEQLSAALVKADAAGNAADAKVLADAIRQMRSAPAAPAPAAPAPAPAPTAPSEIPMGRRVLEFVRPTVEALGAVGGGAALTPFGPLGTVGGAGLGYGMAKGGLDLLEQQLGYQKPPASVSEALVERAKDVLTGATLEAGGRAVPAALGAVAGKVMDLRQIPQQKAAAIAKGALGDDLSNVVSALRAAKPNASVAEITAGIENPAWQALVQRSLERDPQFLRKMNLLSERESRNALAGLAGGATAAETRAVGETAKRNLNVVTTPMREAALGRANLGKYVADEAAARQANDLAVLMETGGKLDPAQFAAQATGAEQALRSVGVKPLDSASLASRIEAIPKQPQLAENDLIEDAATRVAGAIRKWSANGVLDANALEAIRKNAVNATIAKLRPGADATTQRNAAASVMSNIKPLIDDAIEAAGGAGWRDYLATHAEGMARIAEKKLTGEAARLWKTDKDAFVRLVQNESPDVVEKFLGPGRYDIAKELADNTMSVLREQANKQLAQASVKTQIGEGQAALVELMRQNISKVRLPSHIKAWVTNVNKVLQVLEEAVGDKTLATLTEAMKTPQGAADLLSTLPGKERLRVMTLLDNPMSFRKPGQTAAVAAQNLGLRGLRTLEATPGAIALGSRNALAPESENALAP